MGREKEDKQKNQFFLVFFLLRVLSQGGPVITEGTPSRLISMTWKIKINYVSAANIHQVKVYWFRREYIEGESKQA